MASTGNQYDDRLIKRIRQACTNCRRKKVRCSGQRPICSSCRHLSQECDYSTGPSLAMTQPSQDVLFSRVTSLEAQLAQLASTLQSQSQNNMAASQQQRPLLFNSAATFGEQRHSVPPSADNVNSELPSAVIQSAVDDYFNHCHNQPYSLFQEQRFRRRMEMGLVPRYLLLVFLACAIRASTNLFLHARERDMADSYRRESWKLMIARWQEINEETEVGVIQALALHCILDLAEGKRYGFWIKIGLAVRNCQDLRLMLEPSTDLDSVDQEERRRVFWSIYVLDKFAACERTRPSAIADDDCHVQFPSDEEFFRQGLYQKSCHMDLIRSTDWTMNADISQFGLLVILSSTLGRCAKYNLHEQNYKSEKAPWDSTSDFAVINSFLYLVESNFRMEESLKTLVTREYTKNGVIDQQRVGHLILSRTVYHLCRLLLHHPLLLLRRANELLDRAPTSFFRSVLQSCREYAATLVTLIRDAIDIRCAVSSPFYAYCVFIAGTVRCLDLDSDVEMVKVEASKDFEFTRNFISELSKQWKTAGSMSKSLEVFQTECSAHCGLVRTPFTIETCDITTAGHLARLMDHGLFGSPDVRSFSPEAETAKSPSRVWTPGTSNFQDLSESPLAHPENGPVLVQQRSDVAYHSTNLAYGDSFFSDSDPQDVSPLSHFLLSQEFS